MIGLENYKFRHVTSEPIIIEVSNNLPGLLEKLGSSQFDVGEFIVLLLDNSDLIEITNLERGVASHPEDDLVLATAVSGQAEVLVTGDKQLLAKNEYRGVQIITPRQFLELISD